MYNIAVFFEILLLLYTFIIINSCHGFFSGLLNSPSKSRTQDLQIDTGIISWDDNLKRTDNIEGRKTL